MPFGNVENRLVQKDPTHVNAITSSWILKDSPTSYWKKNRVEGLNFSNISLSLAIDFNEVSTAVLTPSFVVPSSVRLVAEPAS